MSSPGNINNSVGNNINNSAGGNINNSAVGDPSRRKVYRAAVLNTTELLNSQARDVGDKRMTESENDRSGSWLSRTTKRIWKHNYAQEWYRQREIKRAKRQILESGNLYSGEEGGANVDHEQAMGNLFDRFTSEYEEDMLRDEERQSKVTVTDPRINQLLRDYATGACDVPTFNRRRSEIISSLDADYGRRGLMHADNLLNIANELRTASDNGKKMDELDFDVELTLGRARDRLSTESNRRGFDHAVEWMQNSKIGKYFVNESIAAFGYSIFKAVGQTAARTVGKVIPFVGGAVVAGGIAAAKERARFNRERGQHSRERAKGMQFDPNMERRSELEGARYQMRDSREIINRLGADYRRLADGTMATADLSALVANLADLEARRNLANERRIDLIGFSHFSAVETESRQIDELRARIKVALRRGVRAGSINIPGMGGGSAGGTSGAAAGGDFDAFLRRATLDSAQNLLGGDHGIEAQDRTFRTMRRKRVAGAFVKTTLSAMVVGTVVQEGIAAVGALPFFHSETDGVIGGAIKSVHHHFNKTPDNHDVGLHKNATALESLRRFMAHENPRVPQGAGHEVLIGGPVGGAPVHLHLPDNVQAVWSAPSNTYDIVRDGNIISHNVHLEVGPNGDLTDASKEILAKDDIYSSFSQTGEHLHQTAEEYVKAHPGEFTKIHYQGWEGNNTEMYIGADGHLHGADFNETKVYWGGPSNTGIDQNGNYVFDVSHVTNDGSFQKGLPSVFAHDQMAQGNLKMAFVLTRGTEHFVMYAPVDSHGNAIIDHNSSLAKLMFENKNGHAHFIGRYSQLVYQNGSASDGADKLLVLATLEGNDINTIDTDTLASHVKFDVPDESSWDMPPILPIVGRRPLESGVYGERPDPALLDYYGYGGLLTSKEQLELFEKMRSKTLKDDPNAKLDHYKEIGDYLVKQEANYLAKVKKLAEQTDKMKKECKVSVCIPVAGHQEGAGIYDSLKSYAGQTANPDDFEVVLFVNHPDKDKAGVPLNATETLDAIEKFKKDYPKVNLRVMYSPLPIADAKIGKIRKILSDATLVRQHERGKDAPDLIMISNDADNKGIDPKYIQSFIDGFEKNESVDGMLGQLDWDPESYQQYPAIHVGTRLFQYLSAIGRHRSHGMVSSGANSAFRSSMFAGIGGYVDTAPGGEDVMIGKAIVAARNFDKKRFAFAGTGTRLFTSSRRAIDAYKSGLAPVEQWDKGFSAFDDEIRKMTLSGGGKIEYDNPTIQEKLKKTFENIINRTVDVYEKGSPMGKGAPFYRKAIGWLGVKYDLDSKGNIVITDMKSLIEGLKKYQVEGKLMRDARSGSKDAKDELARIRGSFVPGNNSQQPQNPGKAPGGPGDTAEFFVGKEMGKIADESLKESFIPDPAHTEIEHFTAHLLKGGDHQFKFEVMYEVPDHSHIDPVTHKPVMEKVAFTVDFVAHGNKFEIDGKPHMVHSPHDMQFVNDSISRIPDALIKTLEKTRTDGKKIAGIEINKGNLKADFA